MFICSLTTLLCRATQRGAVELLSRHKLSDTWHTNRGSCELRYYAICVNEFQIFQVIPFGNEIMHHLIIKIHIISKIQ